MTDYNKRFEERLQTRNAAQLRAIDAIYGPVMVVAGPGTGKTDVLGLRIGNIIRKTGTPIQNILCLTFTEAGAVEMRNRLLSYIGPEAYNAAVFTFHGFCNMVIHENLRYFNVYNESQPVSDLERFQLLREMIDSLDLENPVRRNLGQRYFEIRRLAELFDVMKREDWSVEYMNQRIDRYIDDQRQADNYYYKRKTTVGGRVYEKGDFKDLQFEKNVVSKMELLRAAIGMYDEYNKKLHARNRYEYQDMLKWVVEAFKSDDTLLAEYQERYQFFLVDEFQDTNGIQLELLKLLVRPHFAANGEKPDVFVVGDDDQSIFRFQGAMMENIIEFKKDFDPEVVILTDNYRSTQNVLDAAASVIRHNEDRLVARYPEYSKDIKASSAWADLPVNPEIRTFENWSQEQIYLVKELTELHNSGALERESVAVIYRNHYQVEGILEALEKRKVPLSVKKPLNVLYQPIVQHVIALLNYIVAEKSEYGSGRHYLYQIMQMPYFEISVRDAGLLAIHIRRKGRESRLTWREVMASPEELEKAGVREPEPILRLNDKLDRWTVNFDQYTAQGLLQEILTDSGILNWVFQSGNRAWDLQVLKTFFDHLNNEVNRSKRFMLNTFLEDVELMNEYGIQIPVQKVISEKHGVNFITAHSAKGMEFDRVYIIGCVRGKWDDKRSRNTTFTLPDMTPSTAGGGDEEERRLFYVAMTRARRELIMSYHLLDDSSREKEASRFIEEARESEAVVSRNIEISQDDMTDYIGDLLLAKEEDRPLIDHEIIDLALEEFAMSVSALNAYIECPRKFYFEQILNIPSAPHAYFEFGNAVHGALEEFVATHVKDHRLDAGKEALIDSFRREMERRRSSFTDAGYESYVHEGEKILGSFFDQRKDEWTAANKIMVERRISSGHHKGVPIKGFLDRVDFYKDHVVVTDYKTGKPKNARGKLKPPKGDDDPGGNYWRQLVFYKFLVGTDPQIDRPMAYGKIDFVVPDENGNHVEERLEITPEDEKVVSEQLTTSYRSIMNREFSDGCNADDCQWCRMVNNEMRIMKGFDMELSRDEIE